MNRSCLFIQTKFYPQGDYGYDSVMYQFEDSISKLGLDYLDAYLIHQPVPRYCELNYRKKNSDAWKAFEQLYKDGRIRSIGVSNFLERHIEYLIDSAEIIPMINQIEINPYFQQIGLSEWCKNKGIVVQSWGPLSKGVVLCSEELSEIAKKYNISTAQLCIKWNIQKGNIPIVMSSSKRNILANFYLDFCISDEDMESIRQLNSSTKHRETWWYPRQQMY